MSLVVLGGGHLLPCPTPTCLQLKGDLTAVCWGGALEVDVDCRSMVVGEVAPAAASTSSSTEKDVRSAAPVTEVSSTAADGSEAAVASVSRAASADAALGPTAGQGRQITSLAQASRARTKSGAPSVAADGAADANRQTSKPDISVLASAVAAAKLGLVEQLSQALATCSAVAYAKDAEDRSCLHYAAGYGHEECVSLLLEHASDTKARDANGDLPLHFAAIHGHPMCAYNITKACPAACLMRNYRGQTPVEVAVACERGEVLNAMLLACAGDGTAGTTVQAMRKLLSCGAVPDTWAPNGSSALMLAAAANGAEALAVLLEAGATVELQDALGRSALMFAAGNSARDTLLALLDAGACISQRDRRGRNVLDYAPEGSEVRRLLQGRLDELEAIAARLQEDLLASLSGSAGTSGKDGKEGEEGAAPGGKKKKNGGSKKVQPCQSSAKGSSSGKGKAAQKQELQEAAAAAAADAGASAEAGPKQVTSAAPSSSSPGSGLHTACAVQAPAVTKDIPCSVWARGAVAGSAWSASQNGVLSGCMAVKKAAPAVMPHAVTPVVEQPPLQQQQQPDGDDSSWQTVCTHKCSSKARQLQHGQHHHHADSGTAPASPGLSTKCPSTSSTKGSAIHIRVVSQHVPALTHAHAQGPSAVARTAKRQSTGCTSTTPAPAASAAGAAPFSTTPVCGFKAALLGKEQFTVAAVAAAPVAVPLAAGARAATTTAPLTIPTGAKASSLVGSVLDEQVLLPYGSPCGAVGTHVARCVPVVAASRSLLGSAPAGMLSSAAAAAATAAPCERKPAWGGARPGHCPSEPPAAPAATTSNPAATSKSGSGSLVSPTSFPPLCARPPAPAPPPAPKLPAGPVNSTTAPAAPAAPAARRAPSQAAASPSPPPAPSCPPSIASVADSEASYSSRTSTLSSHHEAAAACSPRSFGHNDWTRPSPVDVLQAALAASAAAAAAAAAPTASPAPAAANTQQQSHRPPTAHHSKTNSATSSLLSFDGSVASSGCSLGLGLSLLGGGGGGLGGYCPVGPLDAQHLAPSAAAAGQMSAGGYPGSTDVTPMARSTNATAAGEDVCLVQREEQQQREQAQVGFGSPALGLMGEAKAVSLAACERAGVDIGIAGRRSADGDVPAPLAISVASGSMSSISIASAVAERKIGSSGSGSGGMGLLAADAAARDARAAGPRTAPQSACGGSGSAGSTSTGSSCSDSTAGVKYGGSDSVSQSAAAEVARLRAEKDALQRRLRQSELRHGQELASVLQDAEAHEAALVETALAQERLRITANLLAIGLCPEAILAVITPPGHGMDAAQLVNRMAAPPAPAATAPAAATPPASSAGGATGTEAACAVAADGAAGAGRTCGGAAAAVAAVSGESAAAAAGAAGRCGQDKCAMEKAAGKGGKGGRSRNASPPKRGGKGSAQPGCPMTQPPAAAACEDSAALLAGLAPVRAPSLLSSAVAAAAAATTSNSSGGAKRGHGKGKFPPAATAKAAAEDAVEDPDAVITVSGGVRLPNSLSPSPAVTPTAPPRSSAARPIPIPSPTGSSEPRAISGGKNAAAAATSGQLHAAPPSLPPAPPLFSAAFSGPRCSGGSLPMSNGCGAAELFGRSLGATVGGAGASAAAVAAAAAAPAASGHQPALSSSFGSYNAPLVGSLCAGLGLGYGALSGVARGSVSNGTCLDIDLSAGRAAGTRMGPGLGGCLGSSLDGGHGIAGCLSAALGVGGLGMATTEEEEEEEDEGMDLPACGDISALLAMSDDDDEV